MPYRFIEEIATADIAFEAWDESLEKMFMAAAEALLATMVEDPKVVARRHELHISLEHEELDLLLFGFLSELVFYKDAKRLLLHADEIVIVQEKGALRLNALLSGDEISTQRHALIVDVKAVTLHRLQVIQIQESWRATVVVDI